MSRETLTVTDNRTGKSYELAITDETVKATDLRQIKESPEDFGMMTYDPAFMNTAACRSAITFIDGDKGILEYRGYPIDQLAEHSSHLEVAWLLLEGDFPDAAGLERFEKEIADRYDAPDTLRRVIGAFDRKAHPMGILIAAAAALGTEYPESKKIQDPESRAESIRRLIGVIPTVGAWAHRHREGLDLVAPDPSKTYAGNFLHMMFSGTSIPYDHPALERALDVLFILHADHEQNCSTSTMRNVGSSHADPYSSVAAAAAALYGPLHGGANEAVIRMLDEIGSVDAIPEFIEGVKNGEGRLMGFGHRVYKNYDPRAKIIKQVAHEVFDVTGKNPLLDVAMELERIALEDEYFVKRKLYPNVDFYSGLIYQAMSFPMEFFTVLFAIPRVAGWLAQWQELLLDSDQKIARPRQIYTGPRTRNVE